MKKQTMILLAVGGVLLLAASARRTVVSTQTSSSSPQTDGLLPPLEGATTALDPGGVTATQYNAPMQYGTPPAPPVVGFTASAGVAASGGQQSYSNESLGHIGGASIHRLTNIANPYGG